MKVRRGAYGAGKGGSRHEIIKSVAKSVRRVERTDVVHDAWRTSWCYTHPSHDRVTKSLAGSGGAFY